MKKLNYIFKVEFKSCAPDAAIQWVRAMEAIEPNDQKKTPQQIAGEIAAGELGVTERGVRVTFLGLREQKAGAPITRMNPFTLTLIRDPN